MSKEATPIIRVNLIYSMSLYEYDVNNLKHKRSLFV